MRSFGVATTCNRDGWKVYGHRFLAGFKEFWPDDVPLFFYTEGFEIDRDLLDERIIVRELPTWVEEFKRKHPEPAARGLVGQSYNLFKDAVKFAHKVGAWTDAALYTDDGFDTDSLIIADADIVTHAPITRMWLDKLLPDECYISWFDRVNNYPECGFFCLDLMNPHHVPFVETILGYYHSGAICRMQQCHDCWALQLAVHEFTKQGWIRVHSLSGRFERSMHPLVNVLGDCLDHCKGPRKFEGRSRRRDLVVERTEPYWQS